METKQTAVEWLIEQWEENPTSIWYTDFDKAKQMEKEQITEANLQGLYAEIKMRGEKQAEEYYNETYGK